MIVLEAHYKFRDLCSPHHVIRIFDIVLRKAQFSGMSATDALSFCNTWLLSASRPETCVRVANVHDEAFVKGSKWTLRPPYADQQTLPEIRSLFP